MTIINSDINASLPGVHPKATASGWKPVAEMVISPVSGRKTLTNQQLLI
jgi:hypothetical protein